MEERKVNIKPGNVKPTRSVRARSSSSFDNSVNTNIRKYTFINILFHRKIYKIVFIYDVSLILKRDYLQFICHKHTNSRRILLQCNCNRKWFHRIYILMKRLMKDSRKKFPWLLQNIVLQRKFISFLHVYRTLEKLTTYINVFANFYESAVNYVSSVSKYLR